MTTDPVAATGADLRLLRDADPGLRLLRAELMPVVVAILGRRLTAPTRVLPAVEFTEAVSEDLAELRSIGFDLPRSAGEYVASWVGDGFLIRRPTADRDETVELSDGAQAAIRFVLGVQRPRSSVTSSRLSNVSDLLARLAVDTDPEPESRLAALEAERAAVEARIERVRAGHAEQPDDATSRERLEEILRLAGEIPGDFARVSADLERVNHGLREQIIARSGSRGDVLDGVFAGVDLIEQSESGRTFAAFHALVLDAGRAAEFDAAVEAVLARAFTGTIPTDQRRFLRGLLTTLQDESTQVRRQMTGFSRSLRRFVESRALQEHRRLADALQEAQAAGLTAFGVGRPFDELDIQLDRTSFPLSTIGSWTLTNPADQRTADPVIERANGLLDLAALRRQVRASEIDFVELRAAVAATMEHLAVASVGAVLSEHPATQGLASVVGLLVLASQYGLVSSGDERLRWRTGDGTTRTVSVRRYVFSEVPESWSRR
ncbi:DUF3375 domain-containing protein [Raineyella sp. W15-4]|uniref:DUF3375 domain-containing protein n=1 Tax=Raineyella sp. W15-4 TaxID=3081651 RepID=UPI002952B704|nr:DUF3375 domain-containing protein [Raineyella sp. W15-4]WOQ17238.1 DUF3375 domain-containing protein [Raineyella sp. W15-4]